MKIYPEDKRIYILYLYSTPHILPDIFPNMFNYKSYIQKLIGDSRHNLLTLQISYR